jgi:hypothetical protein
MRRRAGARSSRSPRLTPLDQRVGVGEQSATATQQVLTLGRQLHAAADAVEEPHTEVALEVAHLAPERGLRHVQPRCRTRHAGGVHHGDEIAEVSQLH